MSYCTDFEFKAYLKPEYRKGICDETGKVKLSKAPYKPFRDFVEYMEDCVYTDPLDYSEYDEETGCWKYSNCLKHMQPDEYDRIVKLLCEVSERVEYCRARDEDQLAWFYYDIIDGEAYDAPATVLKLNCTIKPDFADDLLKIGHGEIPQYIWDFMHKYDDVSFYELFNREDLQNRRIDLDISLSYADEWIDAFVNEFVSPRAVNIEHFSTEKKERGEKCWLFCD